MNLNFSGCKQAYVLLQLPQGKNKKVETNIIPESGIVDDISDKAFQPDLVSHFVSSFC